jgi:hypothetical protein
MRCGNMVYELKYSKHCVTFAICLTILVVQMETNLRDFLNVSLHYMLLVTLLNFYA